MHELPSERPAGARLETWGEIAQYLRVEIRTAQRWERHLGLPIRRLEGTHAVYAYAEELAAWRSSREIASVAREGADDDAAAVVAFAPAVPAAPPVSAAVPPVLPAAASSSSSAAAADPASLDRVRPWDAQSSLRSPASADSTPPVVASRRWGQGRRRNAIVLAIAAAALGAVLWAAATAVHPRREPQALAVSGMTLQAVDANGQTVWSYAFDRTAVVVEGSRRPDIRRWWRRVDIDADGVDELAAVVAHPNNDGTEPVETLYVFSLDGRLRFRYQPDLDLRFARGRFTGPWLFWDFAVVRQDRRLWLALTHHPWWPSALVSVDIAGRAAIRFVQPGWIRMLRVYESNGRARVLAAGVNNEHAAASLALLDPAQPAAAAPAPGGTEFTCLNCPTGQPLKYVLLPRSPLNVVNGDPYNYANEVTVSDGLSVITTEAYPSGGMSYELTRDLVVESMRPIDSYWTWSRAQGPSVPWAGRIGHPATAIVRTWTPAGWTTQTLPYDGLVPSAGDSTRR